MRDMVEDAQSDGLAGLDGDEEEASSDNTNTRETARSKDPIVVVVAPTRLPGILNKLAVLATLGIFSFFGLLARLGLTAINTYNGEIVFPLIYAQMTGCAVMGLVASRRKRLEEISLMLYVGLATGLCGSITTFSSWMLGVFEGFARIDRPPHGGFYNFIDGLSQTLITVGGSYAAFVFGAHLAPYLLSDHILRFLGQIATPIPPHMAPLPANQTEKVPTADSPSSPLAVQTTKPHKIAVILLFLLLWLAATLICVYVPRWRGIVMFALLFAPCGTWLRFYLSDLNIRFTTFPLGTFLANSLGTAILATCVALQRTGRRTTLQCQVLQGFDDGFCGCLTTISTFIAEVSKLKRGQTYRYVLASWITGQLIMLVILGSVDFAQPEGLSARCQL